MPDFDPDKYIKETGMGEQGSFDPDKYLAETGLAAKAPAEDQHAFGPFIKKNAQAMLDMSGKVGQGMVQAALHPIDTASQVGSALMDTSPQDVAAGANRAVRNIPLVGGLVDQATSAAHAIPPLLRGEGISGAAQGVDDFSNQQAAADQAHAQAHPLTDFMQKAAGVAAIPGGAIGQLSAMSADAFAKSLEKGSSTYDALQDARNVAALGSLALTGGHMISKLPGKAGASLAKQAGVSEEAMQDYVQQAKSAQAAKVAPKDMPPVTSEMSVVPEAAPPAVPTLARGEADFNFGKKLGQVAGGAVGGFSFGPAGAVVGRDMAGHAAHAAIDGLANKYGHQAVKMALDGGIALEKIADTPYAGTLLDAANQSPRSLAITHYILGQTDPAYQELSK